METPSEKTPLTINSKSQYSTPIDPVPVTVLSGFLGSGKTTLLTHILNTNAGNTSSGNNTTKYRIAVLVNDMGKINIDAALVKKGPGSAFHGKTAGMVELANGCLCCTLQKNMVQELMNLVKQSTIDFIVVEGSGIAEPKPIAEIFNSSGSDKWDVQLDTLVTVVDSQKFLQDYYSENNTRVGNRPDLCQSEGASKIDSRLIVELLVNQIEVANVIVLNKTDLITKEQLNEISDLVQTLNPEAKILHSEFSRVPLPEILGTKLYSKTNVSTAPLGREYKTSYSGRAGIKSFSHKISRPFHPQRLHNLVTGWKTKKIVRSKGFVVIASDNEGKDDFAYWAHAGNHLRLEKRDRKVDNSKAFESQLVFIGINMNEYAIKCVIDECTLNSEEMAIYNQGFNAWKAHISEHGGNPLCLSKEPWRLIKEEEEKHYEYWVKIEMWLCAITIFGMIIEGIFSVYYGTRQGISSNIALTIFGLDSFVEIASAMLVIFRFRKEVALYISQSDDTGMESSSKLERQTSLGIGVLFIILSICCFVGGINNLLKKGRTDESAPGLIISATSITLMSMLTGFKLYASISLNSQTVKADAICSFVCMSLTSVILIGSLLELIFPFLYWLGDVATIIIGILLAREAKELIQAALHDDFAGCCDAEDDSWIHNRIRTQIFDGSGTLKQALKVLHIQESSLMMTRSGGNQCLEAPRAKDIDELQDIMKKTEVEIKSKTCKKKKAA